MRLTDSDRRRLKTFLLQSEANLMQQVLFYALKQQYTRYTSTLLEAWRVSIQGLSDSLQTLLTHSANVAELQPDEDLQLDPAAQFGLQEAERHRHRGVNLAMFLGLMKYYRQSYQELLHAYGGFEEARVVQLYVDRFFDRTEIAYSTAWMSLDAQAQLQELSAENRKLEAEKNLYLTLFESLSPPVIFLGSDFTIQQLNFSAQQLFTQAVRPGLYAYGEESLPKLASDFLAALQNSLASKTDSEIKFQYIWQLPDEAKSVFEVSVSPSLDISQQFSGYILSFNDITKRYLLDREKHELEHLYQSLFESINEGVALIDPESLQLITFNEKAHQILAYSEAELSEQKISDLDVQYEEKQIFQRIAEILQHGHAAFETQWVDKQGEILAIWLNARRVVFNQKPYILAVLRDISAQKRHETALQAAKARYQAVVDTQQEWIYRRKSTAELTFANPALLSFLGKKEQQVLGVSLLELLDDRCTDKNQLRHLKPQLDREHNDSRYELQLVLSQNTTCWMEIEDKGIFNHEGILTEIQSVAREISDRKSKELALAHRENQLEIVLAATRRLNRDLDQEQVLHNLVEAALRLTSAAAGMAGIIEQGLTVFKEYNQSGSWKSIDYRFKKGIGVPGRVMETQDVYISNDALTDESVLPSIREKLGFYNLINVPIVNAQGELLACFELHNKPEGFIKEDELILQSLASGAAIALDNAQLLKERTQNQQRLSHSEERLRLALLAANGGVWEHQLQDDVFYISAQVYQSLGYQADEFESARDFFEARVLESSRQDYRDFVADLLSNNDVPQTFDREMMCLSKGDEQRLLRSQGYCVRDALSNEALRLVGVFTDVTESRNNEKKLKLAATVFDSTVEGVVLTDSEGNIQAVNHAFTEVTGYSEAEALGQNPRLLKSGRHDAYFYYQLWQELLNKGVWRGEIWNRRKNGEIYPEWLTISQVEQPFDDSINYVAVFSDLTHVKESQKALDYLSNYDSLTRLPNRVLFEDRLKQALLHAERMQNYVAVLMLDLDRFKNINDSFGHPVGDQVLDLIGQRLRESVREGDTVARFGGDMFALILERLNSEHEAAVVAEKLLHRIAKAALIQEQKLITTASIGISLYPQDGKNTVDLIQHADVAMYKAKDSGRNSYQFYTRELTTAVFERVLLESHLRQALKRQQFELFYQAQVSLVSGKVIGAEALIRWRHPEMGLLGPDKFIGLAEESDLIDEIGEWVLVTACTTAKYWMDQGFGIEKIAINLAPRQIQKVDIVKSVSQALEKSGLVAQCLELEITENSLIAHTDTVLQTMEQLRLLGIDLAIDDFGTGYSSLNYLKRFPVHKLKIDQSFVRDIPEDMNNEAIAKAVIALGRSLGMQVIAEGVETLAQQNFLREQGCDEAQGYLYSRPLCEADFLAYLQAESH